MLDKGFLLDLRRQAYVECTQNYLETNTVVGIFGDDMPEELFYACGVVPVPMEGVDSHIFKFGNEGEGKRFCDVIRSTLIYLTTQKCPILYSCKMYVLCSSCQAMIDAIKANTEKPVLIYQNEASLIESLCKVYGTSYSEEALRMAKKDIDYIKSVLQKIRWHSTLDCETVFLLEFYSKYMTDLKMRRAYFEEVEQELEQEVSSTSEVCDVKEISVICPRGNYANVCANTEKMLHKKRARIKRVWKCGDYGYERCPFECERKVGY